MTNEISAAALTCMNRLGVASGDTVLIVCNPTTLSVAEALKDAARDRASRVELLEFAPAVRHGQEPPNSVSDTMSNATVVFAPTALSISHTQARHRSTAKGARFASMPTITEEIFHRAVDTDYGSLERIGDELADALTQAKVCRIMTERGTDVWLELDGRSGRNDDGDLQDPGAFGNLPAGEAYIAPVESSGDGVIVFDASIAGYGRLVQPLTTRIEGGRVVAAEGEWSQELLDMLDAGGQHGRSIAELGIGTNVAARISGNILEDEKVLGTAHIAFGTSAGIGGVNHASVHIDGVFHRPTIELDGRLVLREGRLLG